MLAVRSRSRAGFTLVALLVLLAISGVFLAMFFPAVLRAQAAAKRGHCTDQMKRLALGTHDYNTAFERLPYGWLGPNPDAPAKDFETPASYVGCLLPLLPYLGHDDVYRWLHTNHDLRSRTDTKNIDPRNKNRYFPDVTERWWEASLIPNPNNLPTPTNLFVARTDLQVLTCPDDNPYESVEATFVALSVYGPNAPKEFLQGKEFSYREMKGARFLGRTNYVGVAGAAGQGGRNLIPQAPPGVTWGLYEGIFYNRSSTTLAELTKADGTSNTLMFGEVLGGLEPAEAGAPVVRRSSFSFLCGALPTYHGLAPAGQGPWNAFSSKHERAVHFAFADGSVRGLRRAKTGTLYSEDWRVLQELAGKRDGGTRKNNLLVLD